MSSWQRENRTIGPSFVSEWTRGDFPGRTISFGVPIFLCLSLNLSFRVSNFQHLEHLDVHHGWPLAEDFTTGAFLTDISTVEWVRLKQLVTWGGDA